MANKTFNTRVKNKRDTAANWEAVATTFQPLDGELIIVDTSAGKTRFKVGRYDTAKGRLLYYNEIPFADEYLYNDLNESQGKIYDKLKGIDDKSIIEMTLEPSTGTAAVKQYNIGIWQFPKTGFYKIKLSQLGTNITFLRLYARKTKDDGTLPEDDFSNDNLVLTSGAGGDDQLEYIYILADYLDIDSLTAYKIQFLNPILKQGITWVNTYDKTTQKWSFASAANVNAKNVSSNLTLTKGDTKTVYDGSVAREILIPTKTSELTNDSFVSYAEQVLTKDQQNQAKTNLGIDVLTGNTTTITPTQVKEAILAGRPIVITYTDTTYGNLTFTSFGYSVENNVVVANLVSTYNMQYILADLVGLSNNDRWNLNTTELGTSTDIANNYVKYSEYQILTDEQKTIARTNISAISSSEVSSNYLSLDDTQVLTEIQQDVLKNKLGYINRLKVLSNWVEAVEQCKKESGCVLVIQDGEHNDGDIIPDIAGDAYPFLLIPARVRGTNLVFHGTDAYGNNNYLCSISYPSFKFNVTKLDMDQQTMSADPTEDMQIATKKYVDDKTVVDTALSDTSTNPVQNKVVKAAIDSKPSAADAVYTATASSTDGVAYTATVSGIDSLTVGASFIMIPNKASTSKAPTLNVNGLGAKPIRRRLSSLTTSLQQGYSTNWIALNKPFTVVYDGTAWVIEGLTKTDGADVYGAVAQATADAKGNNIADTYATIAMLQSLLPKVTTITLTSNWVGDASPYYQDIALSCVTETSIVDLQPTPEQLNSWQDDGIAFTTLSGNGTVRVYVAGGKPSSAISVQVRVQEATVI